MAKARQAPSPAARQAAAQRADRDEATAITAAVAETELEITDSIFEDDNLDLDGDNSLEEMGEDIDGDTDIEDDEDGDGVQAQGSDEETEETDDDGEQDEYDPAETAEGDLEDGQLEAGDDREPRGQRGDDRPTARESELQTQISELKGAINLLAQQLQGAQPGTKQATQGPVDEDPEPPYADVIADPQANQKWQEWKDRKNARETRQAALTDLREELARQQVQNADETMAEMANGPDGELFKEAHAAFMALPKSEAHAKLAKRILGAFNPAQAMMDWYETVGSERDRAEAERLARKYGFDLPENLAQPKGGRREGRGAGDRDQPRNGRQPRQEFRRPQRMPASLNGAGGGVRQQVDPRGLDGSDASVAAYVFEN